jgi:release factor glutamine methyltransferase
MTALAAGTVREALTAATDALAAAGVESPRLDSEIMLADASGCSRTRLVAGPGDPVDGKAARRFGLMVRRRIQREPVAYILGSKGFRHIELEVDPRVLVPRPETELLVDVALELSPHTVLDVGTGSGAIALAVADELPGAQVTGVDVSLEALAVARANALRLGLGERVRLAPAPAEGEFDLVLANLPYVREEEWEHLAPEITRHEPRGALVAGPTGLEAIDELLGSIADGRLRTSAIALEVGAGQAPTVAELARRAGFESVSALVDLAGIERVVAAR